MARKFLVVVDDTNEMLKALHFAALRAKHTDGDLVLLYIMDAPEYSHWLGVEAMMQEEQKEIAEAKLQEMAMKAKKITDKMPELLIREGEKAQTVMEVLAKDDSISILVLGANTDSKTYKSQGPGPILSYLSQKGCTEIKVPYTVIPDSLSLEDIERMA